MKRTILLLIIFVFLLCPYLEAEEIFLTLDEAISIGLRDNRDILLKAEDVKKAKAKITEAKSGLLPSLNLTGTWTDTKGYYSKDLRQTTGQATLRQYLYKGGKIVNTIKYNEYGLEIVQAILDKTKSEIILKVKNAFYTLLLTDELTELNKNILSNTQEHLAFLRARYRNGQASESDLLEIESSLSSVNQAYEASLNQLGSARVLLNNLLYLEENTKIKPDARFTYEPIEIAYDEALLQAMRTRPEIKQYETQVKANQRAVEMAKADNRPNIYASWDYYNRSHTSGASTKNWNDYNVIGLTFSWPIFDGWATKAKVEQAITDLKAARLLREKTVEDVTLELRNAYLSLKSAITKLQAVESDVKVYSDNLRSAEQKYQQGIVSLLDLNDARLKCDISLFNKKQVIYDYIIAKGNFDKAAGGIDVGRKSD